MSSLIPTFGNVQAQGNGTPIGGVAGKPLSTPWLDYSTVAIPDNHNLVMWWAMYLWNSDGNFRTSMERVASHFLTDVEFPDLEASEESAWSDFFSEKLDYREEIKSCAYDYLCYGNAFVSMYLPFKRMMRCTQCYAEQPISEVGYRLDYLSQAPYLRWNKTSPCKKCGSMEPFEVLDRRDPDLSRVKLNRYDPNDIEIGQNRSSLRKEFYWRIPDDARRDYQNRARIHIDDTPLEVLEAIAVNGRLRFTDEMMLHQAEPTVSGMKTYGWGIPRSISCFRTAWLQQLTNKLDQAVAIDYTLGLRIISPAPTPGATDPMQTMGMENFVSRISGIVTAHRNNPVGYHTSPFPLQYQFMGGEGGQLLPAEKLKFRQQEYLNQLGIPLEYHQMSMSVQAAPMALRLFEAYWQNIPNLYNRLLNWLVTTLSKVYGLEATKVVMQKTTIADDMERKSVLLQLMSANQLSAQTALRPFGIDAHEEAKKVMQQQAFVQKLQDEYAKKEQQKQEMGQLSTQVAGASAGSAVAQAQGGAPAPGGPMGGAPTGGIPGGQQNNQSLSGMSSQADQIAQQLVGLDEYTRGQELKALRESNKDLHALVMSKMEALRRQASSQGGQMLLAQGAQTAGPAPA